MDSNSRKVKCNNSDDIDRISDLPDSIICKILSCLPLKYAMATTVLSTRWKTLSPFWISPIVLDLDDSLLLNPNQRYTESLFDKFIDFVDKLFNETLLDVPCVNTVILICEHYYYGHFDEKMKSWVSGALQRNVREILLNVCNFGSCTQIFDLLNGCVTLIRLDVKMKYCFLFLPFAFALPNLKYLVLSDLGFCDGNFAKFMDGFPVLEELWLRNCKLRHIEIIHIKSSLLRSLKIEDCWYMSRCELRIDTPNLEFLVFDDCAPVRVSVTKFESLLAAHICIGPNEKDMDEDRLYYGDDEIEEQDDVVEKFLTACSNANDIYLSSFSIEAVDSPLDTLPIFLDLRCLSLSCISRPEGWALFASLLNNAPNLEKLTMKEELQEFGYLCFESLMASPPSCLELHLKEIEFLVFNEENHEIKLIEYLLEHGKVIQKLKVRCLPCKDNTLSRLQMLPSQSKINFLPR